MATYGLQYYKEFNLPNDKYVRLEIHKKGKPGGTTGSIEIGDVVQDLSLQIQGEQGDIDTPIIKTSLSMTFVDAYDIEDGKKNGNWEEFYTSDATRWKVLLRSGDKTVPGSEKTIWGGYVTPDSYSETLVHHGSVNIIARDNLGHMQDFPFDAVGDSQGMISLRELVESAWAKIESPMSLYWEGDESESAWLECEGVVAYETLMNVSAFDGMNWYEAVEKALYSYGAVMRYIGDNEVLISSLRYMPFQGATDIDHLHRIEPIFVSGAQRELVPAAKRIEETVKYELLESIPVPQVKASHYTGKIDSQYISEYDMYLYSWHIANTGEGYGWRDSTNPSYFYPNRYDISKIKDGEDAKYMWLSGNPDQIQDIANGVLNRYAEYSRYIAKSQFVFTLRFGSAYVLPRTTNALTPMGEPVKKVRVGIFVKHDGITGWLQENGEWGLNEVALVYDCEGGEAKINLPVNSIEDAPESILLGIRIYYLDVWGASFPYYVPLYELGISEEGPKLEKNIVNTNYEDSNNVILSRNPEFGPAYNTVSIPLLIKNGIFSKDPGPIPAKGWVWQYYPSDPQQMAVYVHKQLLCYFHKPNNLITGTIVNAGITKMRATYYWKGAEHLLISGTYNLLNGEIENAVLREFTRYNVMWPDEQ